jgi:isocitrate dehydrogenase kinase/phosphatase
MEIKHPILNDDKWNAFRNAENVSFDIIHKTLQLIALLSALTYGMIKWKCNVIVSVNLYIVQRRVTVNVYFGDGAQ